MSDSRWLEIERDMQDGVAHLERAIALFDSTDMAGDDLRAYADRMGFMHAMQAGYTSLENGLKRLLDALGEEQPVGGDWHRDLLTRVCREGVGRPAIFSRDLCDGLDDLRAFRHVAMHGYEHFRRDKAALAADAARLVVPAVTAQFQEFRRLIDPD